MTKKNQHGAVYVEAGLAISLIVIIAMIAVQDVGRFIQKPICTVHHASLGADAMTAGGRFGDGSEGGTYNGVVRCKSTGLIGNLWTSKLPYW